MRLGLTCRAAGRRLGIHKDTAWRWRHRLLAEHLRLGWPELRGTLETTERMTLLSQKGERGLEPMPRMHRDRFRSGRERAWLLITRDRDGHTFGQVMRWVPPTLADLAEVLGPRCRRVEWVLARRPIYERFAALRGLSYARAALQWGPPQLSIDRVFAYDRRMRRWLARFCGVATKYLDHYLRWFALVDRPPDPDFPHIPPPRTRARRGRATAQAPA